MVFGSNNGRFFAGAVLAGFMLAVAGCQSGDSASVLSLGPQQDPKPQQEKVLASSLLAYCPKVTLRDGTAYFNTYAKGGQDDRTKIIYQASISDVTRDCSRANGTLNMKVAVAGKVVPGPLATAGTITMPIRIVVVQGTDVLYSKLHQYQVQISDLSAATQFVFTDADIAVPEPTAKNYQIFAGYDEGPSQPAATAEKARPRKRRPQVAKQQPAKQEQPAQTSISDIPR
jgi:hypothetical protein